MSNDYRFILDKSSRKFICPGHNCGKKRFVRYVDIETGKYIPEQFGRCDRDDHCRYHLSPYPDFAQCVRDQERGYDNGSLTALKTRPVQFLKPSQKPDPSFIPNEILLTTIRNGYKENVFIQNLLHRIDFPFDAPDIEKVITLYRLGTIKNGYRAGAVTFPFIDEKQRIRAIQVKNFDQHNHTIGKADSLPSIIAKHYQKKEQPFPSWLEAYQKNDLKFSCLFGAHLLSKYPTNRIALVEAPKTAIYGSLYFGLPEGPEDLLWLAVYNKSSFNLERCKVLAGRTVYLFPDLSIDGITFNEWKEKAGELQKQISGCRIVVSNFLENVAGPGAREKGADLADLLVNKDWRLLRKPKTKIINTQDEIPKHTEP